MDQLNDGNLVTIADRRKKIVRGEEVLFIEVPYIEIVSPGQKHSTVHRKVTEEDKIKYKSVWEAYQNKEEMRASGTPLRKWGGIDDLLIPEMEHLNIFTVEALAAVPDGNLANLGPGARKLQEAAKEYLEKGDEKDIQLAAANERIDNLEKKLVKLMDANNGESGKKKPGRPRKNVTPEHSAGHAEGDGGI